MTLRDMLLRDYRRAYAEARKRARLMARLGMPWERGQHIRRALRYRHLLRGLS